MKIFRWRVKFSKGENLKYISHLDLYRTLTRVLRRAKIPVVYSQGYNPRPKIALGPPLALGLTSEAEYFDLELEKDIGGKEFLFQLNSQLPSGIKILEIRAIPAETKSLPTCINVDEYLAVLFPEKSAHWKKEEIEVRLKKFRNSKEIPLIRSSKTGAKIVNLKEFVLALKILEWSEKSFSLQLLLRIGPKGAIKPQEVLEVLFPEFPSICLAAEIKRTGLYIDDNIRRLEPMVLGQLESLVG